MFRHLSDVPNCRSLITPCQSPFFNRFSSPYIMRIIAGHLKRRALRAPKGHLTRPTTDRTRESLFNLLQSRVDFEGIHVLDLFAGTGALGFEAISRGAEAVTFVENSGPVMRCCRENATLLEVEEACTFFQSDVLAYIKTFKEPAFDVVLADPPYELDALPGLPEQVLPLVQPGGYFVLEHDRRHAFDGHPRLDTSRPYGRTIVSIFEKELPA
jgi:16S rRNA (guanine(966)-N(2))-methyltransferase RsmD